MIQPLRIPGGWTVIYNKFEDIEPETLEPDDEKWLSAFNEDILLMNYKLVRRRNKQTEEQEIAVDLGWYPDGDPNGKFRLQAILNKDWNDPLLDFSSRSKDEIVKTLEKWLRVDFMPVRFINGECFKEKHKIKYT